MMPTRSPRARTAAALVAITAAAASWLASPAPVRAQDDEAAPAPADEATTDASAMPVVVMKTSLGDIHIELNPEKAPASVANFLEYVDAKFYDNTIFHRVIDGFMIQAGGFAVTGESAEQKETRDPIANEAKNGLENARGTIAMARTRDPDSATSQFFINVKDNANLDHPNPDGHGYAVFGKVVEGMDVVDKIKAVETGVVSLKARTPGGALIDAPMQNVPLEPVVIESVRLAFAETEDSEEAETEETETDAPGEDAEGDAPAEENADEAAAEEAAE